MPLCAYIFTTYTKNVISVYYFGLHFDDIKCIIQGMHFSIVSIQLSCSTLVVFKIFYCPISCGLSHELSLNFEDGCKSTACSKKKKKWYSTILVARKILVIVFEQPLVPY